ncbi:MAG: glycosyltransferase family 4 protein [Myxococcales bacterium]|nr:glycosyltransferase family 4 protein [Myxococcales bacterium]
MPSLLVVSQAAINTPHRKAYDLLARRHGWTVHLVAPAQLAIAGAAPKRCDPAPPGAAYSLHALPLVFQRDARLSFFRGLTRRAAAWKPDIVFVEYDPGSVAVLEAFAAGARNRAKIVAYTVENLPDPRGERALGAARRGALAEAAKHLTVGVLREAGRRLTTAVACLNRDGEAIVRDQWRWAQPTALVPLGVDLELFHPADARQLRESLGLSDAFVLGYFGRLMPEKCVHLLVEALAQLPPQVKLLLDMFKNFSPGSYAAELLDRAERLGVRDRIVTVDVAHAEVPKYMNCCDALALVSTERGRFKEQYGRVLPEAMACGVPVIATRSGNLPEIVGDAGIIIPRDSLPDLVAALRLLLDEPARRRELGRQGMERVRAHWTVDVQASRLDGLFRQALARG